MFDCAKDVLSYHNDQITLPIDEQNNMRDRRDANRTRLTEGLKKAKRPAPSHFETQGSYAMRTMIQLPGKNWDIDDGVYFKAVDLTGERGGEMSALEARQMVRDALDDGSFTTKPEVRTKCVRVYYNAGYRVDIPVYRIRIEKDLFGTEVEIVELAGANWIRSDAREVTKWFNDENEKQSPDTENGRQLRRLTRDVKKYARSRESWAGNILSGFGITKLVTECFRGSATREDEALVNTLRAIRDRLAGC
jgi:cyclic GMP-AMP synthase DncV-like protein